MNIHNMDNPYLPVDQQDIDAIEDRIEYEAMDNPMINEENCMDLTGEEWEGDFEELHDPMRYFIIRFSDLSKEKQQDIMNEIEDDDRCNRAWFELGI